MLMEKPIIAIILILFVFGPLVTLIHELGHALHALLVTRKPIYVYVGGRPANQRLRFGRLVIGMGPTLNPLELSTGVTTWPRDGIGHWGHVFILIGGPLASWHQLLFYNYLAVRWNDTQAGWVMQIAVVMAFSSLLLTIIPLEYPAWLLPQGTRKNDARRMVDHLRAIRAERMQR